ncbi:hypothetical protein EVAR_36470_1 [Eumeta japonica]|uniref:Uncharacterized protein n=1 Tax=Eumeta variegata TaxID=151549 RepID=A0A4C1WW11_EUMVA|nr:hypothetical protein EVAR_36470_1 [Eumeta japonica]
MMTLLIELNKTPVLETDPFNKVPDADESLPASSSILSLEIVSPYLKKKLLLKMPQKRREKKRDVQEYILRCQKKIESLCKEKERKMETTKVKEHAKEMKNAKKLLGLFEPKKKKK